MRAENKERPQVGDIWEGKGGLKVLVRIDAHDEKSATVTLARSGNKKKLSIATIRKSYRLVKRNPQRVEHYP